MLQRHKESKMHREAEMIEAARLGSQRDGGIRQAFSARVIVQRKVLIGALNLMYWLAKEEVRYSSKTSCQYIGRVRSLSPLQCTSW
jgi:hypothetical protein